jgi:hypothetical protein
MSFETVLSTATENALAGTLTDEARVALYRICLTMAADEFFRLEQANPGTVEPEVLITILQITTVCDPDITQETLMEAMERMAEMMVPEISDATQEPISG